MLSFLDPSTLMVLLASLSTVLLIVVAAVLALALAGGAVYVVSQSRRRAAADAARVEEEATQRDTELAHIRQRIEEIYERQQTGSETQFARVNQELEQLQMNLDAKGRQIDGVQGQLRYQLKRHEDEIAELRGQLREAVEVFAAAALPAARPSAPALPAPAEPPVPAATSPAVPAEFPASPRSRPESTSPQPAAPAASLLSRDAADETPAFAPLGELLKNDQELLDDLFSGTALDSNEEPVPPATLAEHPASESSAAEPASLSQAAESVSPKPTEAPQHSAPEPEPEPSSSPMLPSDAVETQFESHDDFEFVDIDSAAMTAPSLSSWSEDDEDELIDLDPVDVWPAAPVPSVSDSMPPHSGDGMSTGTFDDPFGDTSTPFSPESTTDLDSGTIDLNRPTVEAVEAVEAVTPDEMGDVAANTPPLPQAEGGTDVDPSDDLPSDSLEEREDLTTITAVDETIQAQLYALGVTEIEGIARWTRADARRMATQIPHVSEEDIMDRWIFEAQSILFERYQDELREQREQHLNA